MNLNLFLPPSANFTIATTVNPNTYWYSPSGISGNFDMGSTSGDNSASSGPWNQVGILYLIWTETMKRGSIGDICPVRGGMDAQSVGGWMPSPWGDGCPVHGGMDAQKSIGVRSSEK